MMDLLPKKSVIIIIGLLCLFSLSIEASNASPTASANFYSDRDTQIYSDCTNCPYGTETYAYAGETSGGSYQSLFHFDISSCTGISAATLYIYIWTSAGGPFDLNIHVVTSSWTESTRWDNRPSSLSAVNTSFAMASNWRSVDITAIAQDWETGKLVNHGIIIRNTALSNQYAGVWTREEGFFIPYLAITATSVPEGNPIILLTPVALCIICCIFYYRKRVE